MKLFIPLFREIVTSGHLVVRDANGTHHEFGNGTGPTVGLELRDESLHWRLGLQPSLAMGEGYTDAGLAPADGTTLVDLLTLLMRNDAAASRRGLYGALCRLDAVAKRCFASNTSRRARANVAHHYDLDGRLFDLFLDADRQYSCAYFETADLSLEAAQDRKKTVIGRKLLLEPGLRVLDIGSGWGGLALSLARDFGVDVTGLTLSTEQAAASTRRAEAAGLSGSCRFLLRDYRAEVGRYDRIVSVGMFEHVGMRDHATFFGKLDDLLSPDGIALVHTIGSVNRPGPIPPWMEKYIFPGAYVPTLSELMLPVERQGLVVCDVEVWRLHYAETLRHWRQRFLARRAEAKALYDERFCRMWEFYLAAAEVAFRIGDSAVFQVQLAKRVDAVPITRRYLATEASSAVPAQAHAA